MPPSSTPPPLPAQLPPPLPKDIFLEERLSQPVFDGGKIVQGTEGLTLRQVEDDVLKGGRFVMFLWNFSLLVVSFRRGSPLTYIRSDRWTGPQALLWSLPSFFVGWWGIPWGIIFTIQSLYTNCNGGKNLTPAALQSLLGPERAVSVLARAQKQPADPVLWLLRTICLLPLVGLVITVVMAIIDH